MCPLTYPLLTGAQPVDPYYYLNVAIAAQLKGIQDTLTKKHSHRLCHSQKILRASWRSLVNVCSIFDLTPNSNESL